jgi:hypothetical protein
VSDEEKWAYYLTRAAQERGFAERAQSNIAAIRHFELAESYEVRADALRLRPSRPKGTGGSA